MLGRVEKINDLLAELRSEISSLVCDSVINTIEIMFNEKIQVNPGGENNRGEDCIETAVELRQDIFKANMLFTFDYDLLFTLIEKIYPPEILADREAFDDVACEITNIVCNRVKALVNSFGLSLDMGLPYVNKGGVVTQIDRKVLSMHFTLRDSNMHVDFGYSNNKAA